MPLHGGESGNARAVSTMTVTHLNRGIISKHCSFMENERFKLSQKGIEALELNLRTTFGVDAEKELYRVILEAMNDYNLIEEELIEDERPKYADGIKTALYYFYEITKSMFKN